MASQGNPYKGDEQHDTRWYQPQMMEWISKRQQLSTSTGILTLRPPPPLWSSASNPSGDSPRVSLMPLPPLSIELIIETRSPPILYSRRYSPDFYHVVYPLSSFFTNGTIDGTYIYYPLNGEDNYTKIIGSCDGILCLIYNNYLIQLALWNPSTRKYNALPSLDKPPHPKDVHFSDKYKVVALFMYECEGDRIYYYVYKTQVKVHTIGTDSWRLIQ